jgi:putative acetyltransferase
MITIRDMSDSDYPHVTAMWVAAWEQVMPQIDFAARRESFAARLDQHRDEGAERLVAVEAAGEIRGLLVVNPGRRYLDQLAVDPTLHGGGLGGRLLRLAQERSPAGLTLHVNQQNPRAIRFYEKNGWRRGESGVNPRSGLPIWLYHWP